MNQSQVGVILYGPPASGKDTVNAALHEGDSRYELYRRLKVGAGRTAGYRMSTAGELSRLEASGQLIYANERYSATYAIDRPELARILDSGHIPVVHVGQPKALEILTAAMPSVRWITIELWCPRPIAAARIEARATGDTPARLRVWDDTPRLPAPSLQVDTSETSPAEAARLISAVVLESWAVVVPVLHLTEPGGAIDFAATRKYAEKASTTWVDRFLVNGSTTRGDQISPVERAALVDLWASAVGPERVLACAWEASDLDAAVARAVTPMAVMRDLATPEAGLEFLLRLPSGATIYSHAEMFGTSFDPLLAQRAVEMGCLPVAGKLAKVTPEEISELHAVAPSFGAWDGSSRHIRTSIAAGAAGIVATPLAGLLAHEFPSRDMELVQAVANQVQGELDRYQTREERRQHLLEQVGAGLNVGSTYRK